MVQSLKRPKQLRQLRTFISGEKALIRQLTKWEDTRLKKGSLIIKCDDIGDFLIWQQVIPAVTAHAERPICFVGNKVNQPLLETYFDFADTYIWIDKTQWHEKSYRLSQYDKVFSLQAKMAFTPMFTRNFKLDDMLLMASAADTRIAWSIAHHAYYPELVSEMEETTTETIRSEVKAELEYFRNIDFIHQVLKTDVLKVFKPLFPNFGKQNRLVVVPVASAASKCWNPASFAEVIRQVLPLFDSILLNGGKDGIEACAQIEKTVQSDKLMNFCGQTKLHEMIPFIGESALLLCPDTFALHAAMLTATDTVLLTNGTNWQRFTNYSPYISSQLKVIYPPGFKEDPERVKIYYSRSEILGIQTQTVVEAIREIKASQQ